MGAYESTPLVEPNRERFIIERILASNMNGVEENNLVIGVTALLDNPLGHQGLRIGNDPTIHRLRGFREGERSIHYDFQNDIKLNIFKRDNGDVIYNISSPAVNTTETVDPLICKFYKSIGMSMSNEIDRVEKIFKME